MAKVQTRRTISFQRDLFELVHEAAAGEGKSASQWATEAIRERLLAAGKELPTQHFAKPAPHGRTNHRGGDLRGGARSSDPKAQTSVGREVIDG